MLGLDKCVLRPFSTAHGLVDPATRAGCPPSEQTRLFDTLPFPNQNTRTRAISRANFPHPTFD